MIIPADIRSGNICIPVDTTGHFLLSETEQDSDYAMMAWIQTGYGKKLAVLLSAASRPSCGGSRGKVPPGPAGLKKIMKSCCLIFWRQGTGIFFGLHSCGGHQVFYRQGIRIPDQISITGFDDNFFMRRSSGQS